MPIHRGCRNLQSQWLCATKDLPSVSHQANQEISCSSLSNIPRIFNILTHDIEPELVSWCLSRKYGMRVILLCTSLVNSWLCILLTIEIAHQWSIRPYCHGMYGPIHSKSSYWCTIGSYQPDRPPQPFSLIYECNCLRASCEPIPSQCHYGHKQLLTCTSTDTTRSLTGVITSPNTPPTRELTWSGGCQMSRFNSNQVSLLTVISKLAFTWPVLASTGQTSRVPRKVPLWPGLARDFQSSRPLARSVKILNVLLFIG
jgi:hypothetical protein